MPYILRKSLDKSKLVVWQPYSLLFNFLDKCLYLQVLFKFHCLKKIKKRMTWPLWEKFIYRVKKTNLVKHQPHHVLFPTSEYFQHLSAENVVLPEPLDYSDFFGLHIHTPWTWITVCHDLVVWPWNFIVL